MDGPARPTFTNEEIFENLSENVRVGLQGGQLSHLQIRTLVDGLPRIQEKQVIELGEKDNVCPICFVPFLAILSEEEMASVMDSPAHPLEDLGVTKLSQSWQCGHMFCRRDISKWISDGHASCPTCRRNLLKNDQRTVRYSETEEFRREVQANPFLRHLLLGGVPIEEALVLAQSPGANGPAALPVQIDREPAGDRQEFSGMYS